MTLAVLLNITEHDFTEFSFANADHHNLVSSALKAKGVTVTRYILDPIPSFDVQNWLRRHQDGHTQVNAALGINGNDLTDVDFSKPDEADSWAQLHYSEHQEWASALGVY